MMAKLRYIAVLLGTLACGPGSATPTPLDPAPGRQAYRRPTSIPFPETNPYSVEKSSLGARLFFEPALSASHTLSCGTCHDPALAWSDGRPRAIGDTGKALSLRSPTLLNVAWLERLGWDGKFLDLESVSFTAINSAANMNLPSRTVVERLARTAGYADAFSAAFGTPEISQIRIEQALATYERTLVSKPAPFDRWVEGDENAIGLAARRGYALFNGKAKCAECHSGWSFTDGSFHDIGTAHADDIGRGRYFPTSRMLKYAFKTPTLRDVAARAPFMHDGSVASLPEVIALYDRGGIARPSRAEAVAPLHLSEGEKSDLLAFLQALTGARSDRPITSDATR